MGRAFVEIGTKLGPQFEAGLKAAGSKLKSFGAGIAGIGAGLSAAAASVLAPLTAAVFEFAAAGDQLNKMAARTGVAVEALSALKFAAEQSGSSIEELETGIKRMQRAIADAQNGSKSAADALARVGLSVDDLIGLSPEEQFVAIADALSNVADATTRAALAQQLFGRSGTMLLPLINGGAAGIRALTDEAEELGIVMSTEAAQAAADFTDAWNRGKQSVLGLSREIAAAVIPSFTALVETVRPFIGMAIEWIKNNQRLVVGIVAVVAAVGAAGVALTTLGGIIAAAGVAVSALGSAVAFIASPIGLMVVAITAATVAVAGLIVWVVKASGILDGLGSIFGETFGGIIGALQSGDLEAAGEIAVLGLQALWARVWTNIQLIAFDAMASITEAIMAIPGIQYVVGVDSAAMDKALAVSRKVIEQQADDAEKALRIAVDRANTVIEEEPAGRVAAGNAEGGLSDTLREVAAIQEEAAEAQQEAAEAIKAAVEGAGDVYVPGGGAADAVAEIATRGATNTAAAALLVSGGKSEEVVLLEKQFAELKAQTQALREHSALFQMMERSGGGIPVTAGT